MDLLIKMQLRRKKEADVFLLNYASLLFPQALYLEYPLSSQAQVHEANCMSFDKTKYQVLHFTL